MTHRLFHIAAAPFEAALRLPILPAGHRSAGLHGHSFAARIRAELPADAAPFAGAEADLLQQALAAAVAPLDYADLNAILAVPTDENLARRVRARIAEQLPGARLDSVGVRSTAAQGADLDAGERAHLWHRFRFEAAHRLPNVPPGHQCGRMHGHGFEVILHVEQDIAGADMGIDFDRIAQHWAPLQAALDHACLNDIPGLTNPTSEILCRWIWERLKPDLQPLSWVTVYETATAGCHFDGEHYRIWKDLRFESALRLRRGPEGDPRRRLHGHSYLLRLHLAAPLDAVMGWTVDYGDVKALMKPVYDRLDHHRLDELPGLEDADAAGVARWIADQVPPELHWLDRIDLQQTPGCGVVLCRGALGPALPS